MKLLSNVSLVQKGQSTFGIRYKLMQPRTDSRGKLTLKTIAQPIKPYGFKANSRGASGKPLERKDYLKEFKNSLNSILTSYQNKKSAQTTVLTDATVIPKNSQMPRQPSSQTINESSQKPIDRSRIADAPAVITLQKKKSKSTASLKSGSSGIFEIYFKKPLNTNFNSSTLPQPKSDATLSKPADRNSKGRGNSRGTQRNNSLSNKLAFSTTNGPQEIPSRPEDNPSRPNFFKAIKPKPLVPSRSIGKLVNIYTKSSSLPRKPRQDAEPTRQENLSKTNEPDSQGLQSFVTNISESKLVVNFDNPLPPQRSFSQKQLNKIEYVSRPYFFDDLVAAHTVPKCENYFHSLFKIHMSQAVQSMLVLAKVNLQEYNTNGKESLIASQLFKPKTSGANPPVSPPSVAPKKTVIFDLDETLIHCNEDQSGPSDLRVPVVFPSGEKIMAGINVRPYAKEILEELAQHFEVIIFTASHSCYANPVIDYLDEKKIIAGRLFRENCSQVADGLYTKDLRVIKNRELKDLILVDNAVYSFILNLENGIPIIPFYNNRKDTELLKLKDFLLTLKDVDDVRPYILNYFEWETFLKHGTQPEKLYKKLFE